MCTVVGVVHESKNPLGKSFEQIYKKLNIDVRHDSFMANIIILPKDSLLDFIKDIGKF